MRVLLLHRSNFRHSPAGDSVQILKTAEYLNRMGVKADLDDGEKKPLDHYDLIHLFNLMPVEESYRQFQQAQRAKKKIVLSPVFWDPDEYLRENDLTNFQEWWDRTHLLRKEILAGVGAILPNSRMELEILQKIFSGLPTAYIVPNAADSFFASARPEKFRKKYGTGDFLLGVGRVSRRKNQAELIRAAGRLNRPLVLIGPVNDGEYYRECRALAAGHKVTFYDAMHPEELASAYAAARVHALVSWYDTPGLVSLEAALAGCAVVTTDRGTAYEYFGDLVEYCDPAKPESIDVALKKSWGVPPDPRLKSHVFRQYTWEEAARVTYQAYQSVLGEKS